MSTLISRRIILSLLVCLLVNACGKDTNTSDQKTSTPKEILKTPDENFLEANEPVYLTVITGEGKGSAGAYSNDPYTKAVRILSSPDLAALNHSELLLAATWIGRNGSLSDDGERFSGIPLKDIVLFQEFYADFMATNNTTLRRKAAIEAFKNEFYAVEDKYKELIKAPNSVNYLISVEGPSVSSHNYDTETSTFKIKIFNEYMLDIIKIIHGGEGWWINKYPKGSIRGQEVQSKIFTNWPGGKFINIPMDIDEAEAFITATNTNPLKLQILFRPNIETITTFGKYPKFKTFEMTSNKIDILGMRILYQSENGERYYY